MNSLKILYIHWGLIPGGVSKYAQCIDRIGEYGLFQCSSVIIQNKLWPIDKEVCKAIKPQMISIQSRTDFSWIKKLRNFILNEKPDGIFVFGFNGAFASWVATFGLEIPVLGSWHGDYFASSFVQKVRAPFIEFVERLMYRFFIKNIIAVSEYSAKRLVKKGVSESKINVIHNGIPENYYIPMAKKEITEILVGTGCRLSEQKGLFWLLDAILLVRRENRNIRFVIWGDGPQRHRLEEKAKKLGIDDVLKFEGYVDNLEQRLPSLDIFMMSSYAEYFSIALLEAMQVGLPIVATDVGGNPEAIRSGRDGLLVPVEDPIQFSEAILGLAGSVAARKKIGNSARKRYQENFTDEKMIRKTAEWFTRVLTRENQGT